MADERATKGLVSIVMPCCGQLEYTRLSVPRLLRHSRPPFELLFLDAGSLDGTREYLAGVAAASTMHTEIIEGDTEGGFAWLVIEALRRASGEFVAWVNNDVLTPELWLQQLVAMVTANDVIGVVGPMANLAPEQQRVLSIPYHLSRVQAQRDARRSTNVNLDTHALDRFAVEYRQANQGQWKEVETIGGFCWLAKNEVLSQVELFESGPQVEVFDAGRFSQLVRQAGYRLAACRDLYVHHFGNNLLGA
jgi:GT2 family glycosyltransferase